MSTSVRISARVFLCVMAVVFSGLLLVGCGGGGGVGGGYEAYNPLLLSNNEAWTEGSSGYIFNSDWSVSIIVRNNYDGTWGRTVSGSYELQGDNAVYIDFGANNEITGTWLFELNETNTTLSIYDVNSNNIVATLTKMQVSFSTTGPGTGGGQGSLILPTGQAWAYEDDGRHAEGYIYLDNGRFLDLDYGWANGGGWRVELTGGTGTYEVGGIGSNYIAMTWDDGRSKSGTYLISGTVLTLTFTNEAPVVCTARSGVDIDLTPYL